MPLNNLSKIVLCSRCSGDRLVTAFTWDEGEDGKVINYGSLSLSIPRYNIWVDSRKYVLLEKIGGWWCLRGKDGFEYLKFRPDGKIKKRTLYRDSAREVWEVMREMGFERVDT